MHLERNTAKSRAKFTEKTSEKTSIEKLRAMLQYKSRDGLLKPSDELFYLVREFEVDHEKLHAKAIMKSELNEILLDAYQIPGNSGSSLVFQF